MSTSSSVSILGKESSYYQRFKNFVPSVRSLLDKSLIVQVLSKLPFYLFHLCSRLRSFPSTPPLSNSFLTPHLQVSRWVNRYDKSLTESVENLVVSCIKFSLIGCIKSHEIYYFNNISKNLEHPYNFNIEINYKINIK